ncbi:MAG: LEA type 2 family protein [Chitinophagaceae bacterium]
MRSICFVLISMLILGVACTPKDLEYVKVKDWKLDRLTFKKTTIQLWVICHNPNRFSVTVEQLNADLYVDEVYLGKATLEQPLEVPRSQNFEIPLSVEVKTLPALSQALGWIAQGGQIENFSFRIQGMAEVKKGLYRYNFPINYVQKKGTNKAL